MSSELLTISILIILGFAILFYLINKKLSEISKSRTDESLLQWLKSMQSSLDITSDNMVKTLQENSKQLNERLEYSSRVIQEVNKEIGQMSEIGRNMRELQEFLKSPKLRGNIGEQVLKDLISQMFPKESFFLQYEFKSGDKVDAAIKTDAGILPIDSKFPMENFQKMTKAEGNEKKLYEREFQKDVKKHIDAISKKYILPMEGTMDFALMYVPSEAVYYEVVNQTELMEYARKSRIYLVSPSTLYAHLQTILLSFEGKKIELRSKQIMTALRGIQNDYDKLTDNVSVLGKHINNAYSQYFNVSTGISDLGQKINSTKELKEPQVLKGGAE